MKSAKHTKYEGNPRHAKGLQIFSDREYKRLAKRAASMALAAAMAASTLCAPALAIEYDVANGTVHTDVNDNQEVISWQDFLDKVFNHTTTGDNTIDIVDKNGTGTNDQVLNVGSGTTGLGITVDGVTATVDGENVIKVEDGTKVGVTIKDSDLTSTDGEAAISIDGDSVMDIEDSTIKGGGVSEKDGEKHAAIEMKGNSKVALDNSNVIGSGTGVQVQENATLIIGGAEITPGTLILTPVVPEQPEEENTSVIVGNSVTVEEVSEEPIDVSGTAIVAEDNASVIVNEDATGLVVGSDILSDGSTKGTAELIGTGVGVSVTDNASVTSDGLLETYGEQIALQSSTKVSVQNNTTGNTAIKADGSSTINISESGTLYADDIATFDASSYASITDHSTGESVYLTGDSTMNSEGIVQSQSTTKVDGTAEWNAKGDIYLLDSIDSIELSGSAQVNVGGYGVVKGNLELKDNALLKVVDEGTLTVNTLTLTDEYKNPVELGGMLYLENLQKGEETLTDAALMNEFKTGSTFNAVGTGTRFATYDDKNEVTEVYYQIGEGDDRQEVEVDLSRMMYDVLEARYNVSKVILLPGMWYDYNLNFANKSGHQYIYKENSFSIGSMKDFDWNNLQAMSSRTPNEAIAALYGEEWASDGSFEQLKQLIQADQKAIDLGYNSLEDYYLAFINQNHPGANYESLEEVDPSILVDLLDTSTDTLHNGIYSLTDEQVQELDALIESSESTGKLYSDKNDGEYQLKETVGLIGLYNFYQRILGLQYGRHYDSEQKESELPYKDRTYNTIGDYKNEDKYAENEKLFKEYFGTEEMPWVVDQESPLGSFFLFNGPEMGNAFQNFSFGWDNTITLARIDPDPVPPTTDPEEPTPDPDPEEPTLILTPVPEEEEVPEEETPLAPAPVEEIPEEETPLVDAPVIDESLEEVIEELGEEEVPLASAPKTGDESGAFGLMAVLSGMALGVMSFFGKKKEQ